MNKIGPSFFIYLNMTKNRAAFKMGWSIED